MHRRHFFALFIPAVSLAACSNTNSGMKTLMSIFETSFGEASAFDPDYPEKLPYASIAISIKGLKKALLVLGKVEGDECHWISTDRSVLVTRHGRVVKTAGLETNLLKTQFFGADFFERWAMDGNNDNSAPIHRTIDLSAGNRYGVPVTSTFRAIGEETVAIGARKYVTTRFEETCAAPLLSWKFINTYWIDRSGKVWRSIQQISPSLPTLTIEVTKPLNA